MSALVVAAAVVAAVLGAVLRYGVTVAMTRRVRPERLPRAVLIVNLVGCAVAGAFVLPLGDAQYILLAGFAGGLTTFSTWSVETIQLVLDGRTGTAAANVLVHLAGGIAAALVGFTVSVLIGVSVGWGGIG